MSLRRSDKFLLMLSLASLNANRLASRGKCTILNLSRCLGPQALFQCQVNLPYKHSVKQHFERKYWKRGNIRGALTFADFAENHQARIQKPAKIFAIFCVHIFQFNSIQ